MTEQEIRKDEIMQILNWVTNDGPACGYLCDEKIVQYLWTRVEKLK